ncbi:MAG: hypothetical protein RIR90_909 [Bacteroidota bacterium]
MLTTAFAACVHAQKILQTDVLVVGGGVGGTAAGIQAARMGVKVVLTEESVWLGGMMTAAGVSAFDGNHNMPSGIWGEFRNALYKVYGGPNKVATGWVSNTQFEPHVGDSIVKSMVKALPNLSVLYRHRFVSIIKEQQLVKGAVMLNLKNNQLVHVMAKQVIDATELGDVLADAGAGYDIGMEASAITGEDVQVPESNDIVQDLTYVAILKDYGPNADCTIVKPAGYDPAEFDGACTDYYKDKTRIAPNVDAKKMLDYGRLPNKKYMLNWPGYGNDVYLNIVKLTPAERERELEKAKQMTLRFIYFIQHQLGFKHFGLADDEFPTADRLALMPYHREGRRVKGLVRFNIKHISAPYSNGIPVYRTGIAVGDYPIDHHHRKNPAAPQHLGFYPVPSFNVPLGALIPQKIKGLIVAEKGISVSNVVNGTTRLQPCVMMIGQAAGALAALTVQDKKDAAAIPVRKVQAQLLNQGAYIMPFYDVRIGHPHFEAVQRIGATGILRGTGKPNAWANQTWFYADSTISTPDLSADIKVFTGAPISTTGMLTAAQALQLTKTIAQRFQIKNTWAWDNMIKLKEQVAANWQKWGFGEWHNDGPITRLQFAVLLDATVNPFALMPVNHQGQFESKY